MARRRGSIQKRGPEKYLIRVYAGKVDGKRKYTSKTVHGTKKDAEKALTALKYEIDSGEYSDPSGLTVKQWAARWLKGKTNLRETTRTDYKSRLRNDVLPHVGELKLEAVKPHHCRAILTDMAERNLSKRTQQYTHMIFRQCMETAKADKLIPENPMDGAERPSVRKQDKVHEIRPFTSEEQKQFLEANRRSEYFPLWLLLLTTGLRPSEALALEWKHVDFEAGTIEVQQGLSRGSDGDYEIGGVKTESSYRTVALIPELAEALKAHRAKVRKTQMLAGKRSGLVFPNGAFAITDISRTRRRWKKACKRAGVPVIRLYDARHTFATRLIDNGVKPNLAAELMGHSSTKMFLDVYTHVTEKDREGLKEAVQAAVMG